MIEGIGLISELLLLSLPKVVLERRPVSETAAGKAQVSAPARQDTAVEHSCVNYRTGWT